MCKPEPRATAKLLASRNRIPRVNVLDVEPVRALFDAKLLKKERKSTLQYAKRYAVPTPIHVQTVTQSVVTVPELHCTRPMPAAAAPTLLLLKSHTYGVIRTTGKRAALRSYPATCMTYMLCVYRFRVAAVSELQRQ